MTNVHALPTKADPEIVEAFETMLEKARSGEIIGFNIVCELSEHRIYTRSNMRDSFAMLAYLARQTYLSNEALDGSDTE